MNYKGIKDRVYNCNYCNKEFTRVTYNKNAIPKYCSNRCQHDQRMEQSFTKVKEGLTSDPGTQKRVLTELFGYECNTCGISEWQGIKLVLQVDHIDGDPGNNKQVNLRLLCPNCHSQTPTYKGGNKKNPKMDKRSIQHREIYAKSKRRR